MHAQACNTVVLHATQSSCTHRRHAWFLLLAAAKLRLKGGNLCSARSGVQHERLARFVKMTMMRAQRPLSPYAGAAAVVRMRPRKEHNPSIYHLNDFRRFPQRVFFVFFQINIYCCCGSSRNVARVHLFGTPPYPMQWQRSLL